MASTRDNRNGKQKGKSKAHTTTGFITVAIILVTSSLFAAFGTAPSFFAASAQISATQSTNTTEQQDQNQTSTSLSTALDRLREQSRIHQQQQASMNITEDTRQRAREVSSAVEGVLIYYARALGERNIEQINITDPNASVINVRIPVVPLTGLEGAQNATSGSNIVSQADYLIAQGLAIKAIESFSEVAASAALTADPVTMEQLADTQQGLNLMYGMTKNKATYNLVEDVVHSPIKNNLQHIFGATTATVS